MTDFYEALDKQTFQLRAQYLMARYNKRDFIEAANLLYVRNRAAGEGMLDDMEPFKPASTKAHSIVNMNTQAKRYCDRWEALVEQAVTVARSENLLKIRRTL